MFSAKPCLPYLLCYFFFVAFFSQNRKSEKNLRFPESLIWEKFAGCIFFPETSILGSELSTAVWCLCAGSKRFQPSPSHQSSQGKSPAGGSQRVTFMMSICAACYEGYMRRVMTLMILPHAAQAGRLAASLVSNDIAGWLARSLVGGCLEEGLWTGWGGERQ